MVGGCQPAAAPPPDQGASGPSLGTVAPVAALSVIAVRIPSLEVDDRDTMPLKLDSGGVLQAPPYSRPHTIGWYVGGPVPGELGPAVIAAHVNIDSVQGPFAKLSTMKKGQTIEVERSDHVVAVFTVDRVQTIAKKAFPSAAVYGDTDDPELRAITCGPGPLERLPDGSRSFRNQTIAYAHLTGLKPA